MADTSQKNDFAPFTPEDLKRCYEKVYEGAQKIDRFNRLDTDFPNKNTPESCNMESFKKDFGTDLPSSRELLELRKNCLELMGMALVTMRNSLYLLAIRKIMGYWNLKASFAPANVVTHTSKPLIIPLFLRARLQRWSVSLPWSTTFVRRTRNYGEQIQSEQVKFLNDGVSVSKTIFNVKNKEASEKLLLCEEGLREIRVEGKAMSEIGIRLTRLRDSLNKEE